jgi:capsular polysaccharide biosynthesis protein
MQTRLLRERSLPTTRNAVVYFSHGSAGAGAIVNEADLIKAISAAIKPDFELVQLPHTSDWGATASVVARAVVLLGPHGVAFTVRVVTATAAVCHVGDRFHCD